MTLTDHIIGKRFYEAEQLFQKHSIRNRFCVFFLLLITISSCDMNQTISCEWEKEIYRESWDYIVERVYRSERYKATHIIQTTSGKEIRISPVQDIISFAEPGDRIVKDRNTNYAYIIFPEGDTLTSRLFSKSCDDEMRDNSVSN